MKTNYKVVFYIVLVIFSGTALMSLTALAIKLFGLPGHENIDEKYFDKLFYAIIIETATVIFALFRLQFLGKKGRLVVAEDKPSAIKFRFDIGEQYDIDSVPTFGFTTELRDVKGKKRYLRNTLYHDDVGLCSNIEIEDYKQTLSVIINTKDKKYQGSQWLETRAIVLKPIKTD